jgi:hypothetical protein
MLAICRSVRVLGSVRLRTETRLKFRLVLPDRKHQKTERVMWRLTQIQLYGLRGQPSTVEPHSRFTIPETSTSPGLVIRLTPAIVVPD